MFKKLIFATTLVTVVYPIKSNAQIIPDGTLGPESSVIQSIDEFKDAIEGGAIRGENLFHSFTEFSIREGLESEFANPEGIVNIFSRVTGNNISEILGTLSINGDANLFLMNPNGIVFGENAVIDINGSFMATTAESIEFNSGESFNAVTTSEPLLTIDFPVGLGMGSSPGSINITGQQNNVQLEIPSFRVITDNLPESIEVNESKNISIIGSQINFNGGGLKAPQGNVDLASIKGNQTLKLIPTDNWLAVDSNSVSDFKDINFNNAAYVDVSGEKAGNINISGRNIIINDGSAILANSSAPTNNEININASDLLKISGSSGNNQLNVLRTPKGLEDNAFKNNSNYYSISLVSADVLREFQGEGSGNNINVNAESLQIYDAGQIRTVSFSDFDNNRAGDIAVNSESIVVEGTNNIDGFIGSVINSTTGSGTKGNSGNVRIDTSLLEVRNGGRVKADTFSSGRGGRLDISSDEIILEFQPSNNQVPPIFRTGLSNSPGNKDGSGNTINIKSKMITIIRAEINNSSFRRGIPGDIVIDTEQLKIYNAGSIAAETASDKSANISINAKNIELNNQSSVSFGGISTSTRANSFGDGGNINITTNSLKILDGAIIRAISLGSGDAGNISIDANTIEVSGFAGFDENPVAPERISKINTGSLKSNGGELFINSELIEVRDFGLIQATTRGGLGNGGNITIDTDSLQLFNQANITASAEEASNGGNITINSDTIIGSNNSDITANAFEGNGGNIEVNSDLILGIESRAKLTPNSDITASSDLGIDGTVTINSPDTNADDEVLFSAKPPEPDRIKNLFDSSCLNPNRSRLARVILQGRGLPETPYNYFDRPTEEIEPPVEVIKKPQVEPEPQAQKSTPSDLIEPNAIEVDDDGRRFLVALTSEQIQSARVCQQQLDASES